MMLRELEAFEACWLDLKDIYPTNGHDNMEIAHAMGQLVDLLEKPARVEQALPDHLKELFRRLALAYFQGYSPPAEPGETAVVDRLPMTRPHPHGDQRRQEISAAVDCIKVLAQQTQTRMGAARGQENQCASSEMDTLIIDFPEHWHPGA